MMTADQFLGAFPEFASPSFATQWLYASGVAAATLDAAVWGAPAGPGQPWAQYDLAFGLVAAHNLALGMLNAQQAATSGSVPGIGQGVVSSQGAGGVSVSFDTSLGGMPDGGPWNLTTYGTRFLYMARLAGMAPRTYAGQRENIFPYGGPAWYGPPSVYGYW